jgi:hypothetical protein
MFKRFIMKQACLSGHALSIEIASMGLNSYNACDTVIASIFKKEQAMDDNEDGNKPRNPLREAFMRGGLARAQSLSSEERTEIARKAAESRWYGEGPQILCAGELVLGGVKIPCYVTEEGQRIISGRAMQEALRLVDVELPASGQKPGSRLTRLLNNKSLKPLIFKDKSPDHFSPLRARWQGRMISAFNGEMLADICEGMLEARAKGKIREGRQAVIAAQCEILMRAFARVGIAALIDEATGYQKMRPADALRTYLEQILRKEVASWVKRFPDEFYENIYRLKDWPWPGMAKNRYSVVGHYTNDLIFERLAPGLKEEFNRRNPKDEKGNRKDKNHSWFDEPGLQLFSQQMFTVIALQRACLRKPGDKWKQFLQMMDEVLPKKGKTLPLPFPVADGG